MASSTNEAVRIMESMKPYIKGWIDDWTRNCMRSKMYTVTTAPNSETSTIGITDAFDTHEMFIPYSTACSSAVVGDTVWCVWMQGNQQTLTAVWMGGSIGA